MFKSHLRIYEAAVAANAEEETAKLSYILAGVTSRRTAVEGGYNFYTCGPFQ